MPETTVKVTKDSLTISELEDFYYQKRQTVQLKDADPNDIQLFIDKMPASVKGKSANIIFLNFGLSFGFGIKRHMVKPLCICLETGRSRLIW